MPRRKTFRDAPRPEPPEFLFLPRGGSVRDAARRFGVSPRTIATLIKANPRLAKRFGSRTIVCFTQLDALFDALPNSCDAPTRRNRTLRNMPKPAGQGGGA